jgi:hypothetical protein
VEQLANIEITSASKNAERLTDALSSVSRATALVCRMGLLCATLLAGWSASAAEDASLEQRVKAAFLYQFASYVEWPAQSFAQPDTPVTIAVMGAEQLAAELNQLSAGRTVGGRKVEVRQVRPGEMLTGIHILFIGSAENARLAQVVQTAKPRAMLIVTEADGALKQGSMINFVIVDRRVRFEVALDSVERSGLKLSSRLLAVAQQVKTGAN